MCACVCTCVLVLMDEGDERQSRSPRKVHRQRFQGREKGAFFHSTYKFIFVELMATICSGGHWLRWLEKRNRDFMKEGSGVTGW